MARKTREERIALVLDSFLNDYPSLKYANEHLLELGSRAIFDSALRGETHWYYAAVSTFKSNGRNGNWYKVVLPTLAKLGWGVSDEETTLFVGRVRSECKKIWLRNIAACRWSVSPDKLIDEFKRDFPTFEYAKNNRFALISAALTRAVKNKENIWFNSSLYRFKSPSGKPGNWYDCALPNLAVLAWGISMEEAQKFSSDLRLEIRQIGAEQRAVAFRHLSKNEVIEEFKCAFPTYEYAKDNILALGWYALILATRNGENIWFTPSLSAFKSPNGRQGNWYKDVLPKLAELAWGISANEAQHFSLDIKKACRESGTSKSHSRRCMTESQIIAGFMSVFPSLECAQKDLTLLSYTAVRKSLSGVKKNWFNAAAVHFKQPNGKNGNWHGEVLPNLVLGAGWFTTMESALQFSQSVLRASMRAHIQRVAAFNTHDSSKSKTNKKYTVAVKTLCATKETPSFSGVENFLSLGAVEPLVHASNGAPARAVVSSLPSGKHELTVAELLRLKTSTSNWGGELAASYAAAFEHIAPYLSTRLLLLHAYSLAKDSRIPMPSNGASFMSGPGEVYGALQNLGGLLSAQGIALPKLIDIDAEPDMLSISKNPEKRLARLPESGIGAGSLDFVECSSLYQFHPKRYPTIVADTLNEAHRALSVGGALLLSSTGKHFGEKFEEALNLMGFDIVTSANTRLELSLAAQDSIEAGMGQAVLGKCLRATADAYYLVAVKSGREPQIAPAEWLSFERLSAGLPAEVKPALGLSRKLGGDVAAGDDSAVRNAERLANLLFSYLPEQHGKHAVLIQALLDKYALSPKPFKPTDDKVLENSVRLRNELDALTISSKGSSEEKYFILLRRMAQTHCTKLHEAKGKAPPARMPLN